MVFRPDGNMDEWLDLAALVERVQEFIDVGLFDEAGALLDRYASLYKDEWEIYFLYSRICSEQNRLQDALKYLHRALKLDEGNLDCLLGLFYTYAQLNQIQKGIGYLRQAENAYPKHELVLNALIWYHTEICEFQKAIDYYEDSRQVLARCPEALRNIGIAYERVGDFEQARSCYEKALELNPDYDEVRDMLADQYIMSGDTARSVELYRRYLEKSPNNIKALSRLVFCLSQNNQVDEAERQAQQTISRYPNSPVGYVDLSYVYLNSERHDKALEMVEKALDVSPLDAEALRVKAITLSEKGLAEEAESIFDKALSLEPANSEIARDYYQHLRDAGKFPKMLEIINRVIEQEKPYCVEDYWFLADYYREAGKNVKAFHYLHKAYKSMPGESELIPPMADILIEMGHLSMAVPFLNRYVERCGWNEVMDEFARHRHLRGKWEQEGLRYLRYHGNNPRIFREFIFSFYFKRFLFIAGTIGVLCMLVFAQTFFGITGMLVTGSVLTTALLSFVTVQILIRKARSSRPLHGGTTA